MKGLKLFSKISILKFIDRILGRLLTYCCSSPQCSVPTQIGKVIFIRPGGIGDAILLIPAVKSLKDAFPDVIIDILAEKRNGLAFTLCPEVNRVFFYDRPIDLVRILKEKYDVVIDSEQWYYLSAVIARLIRASLRIGFGTNNRKRLFSHIIDYRQDNYEIDSFQDLLSPVWMTRRVKIDAPFLVLPNKEAEMASALLVEKKDRPLVAIFPGASVVEKRWGRDRYRNIVKYLLEAGCTVLVVGGQQDQIESDNIVAGLDVLNFVGRTTLLETAAILQNVDVVLSGDSGVLHIAAGLNRPTVALFGPSNIEKWAPRGKNHIVLSSRLPCSPCSKFGNTPKCPISVKCLQDIRVDEVLTAILKLINKAS